MSTPRERVERAGRGGACGEHAHGRAVDGEGGIGMEVQIRITVLARAIDGHGVHLQVGKDHHRGGAGSARSAEHHGFFTGKIEPEGLNEHLESVVIGVVAAKTPVREARYRVDVAHALGDIG